ncbi:MAG: glycosyltransferase, partial [Gemmatimonadales bacterium]
FNMAMVEAMAAGLPVISNAHPTSPIKHGVDGFVAERPGEARDCARMLLADIDMARTMGAAARRAAIEHFAPDRFRSGIIAALDRAKQNHSTNCNTTMRTAQ